MSYLGGFMGGSPDYNSNPGILGLYQFVQSGYDAGKAKAQNQTLAQLAQKAYTDTGDAQKQDIAQAIGIDPQMGYALAGKAQEQDAAQQAQKLAAFQRLGKAASAIIQAKQAGDETTAEGIYQAIVPELGLMSAQHGGPTPPPTLQGADMGALYKVAAMYASLPQAQKGVVVSAGGAVVNPATGAQMYRNPYGLKYENVPMGTGQAAGAFDPNTGTVRPAAGPQTAAPAQPAPMPAPQASAPQAPTGASTGSNVQFAFAPGTDPAVIAATKAAAGAIDGAPQTAPQAVPAQFGVGTKASVSTLSPSEVAQLGLPQGTIAQRSSDGALHVVSKPGSGGLFGDDGANSFTPEAQQLLAVATEQGLKIPIPSVGMGGAARVQFVNGLAKDINEKHIPLDLALQEMRFGLDADPGLKKSQGLYSTTKTLEAGADNLAQQTVQLAGSVGRGQIPLFNAWVNAGRRATGDPNIARFDRAINAFVNDYAKVVSGSLGSSAASDSARKQAEEQLTAAQSPEQFAASVQQMQKEMHVRTDGMLDSIRQQVANITSGGVRTGAPTFGAGQQPAPATSAPSGWSIEEVH